MQKYFALRKGAKIGIYDDRNELQKILNKRDKSENEFKRFWNIKDCKLWMGEDNPKKYFIKKNKNLPDKNYRIETGSFYFKNQGYGCGITIFKEENIIKIGYGRYNKDKKNESSLQALLLAFVGAEILLNKNKFNSIITICTNESKLLKKLRKSRYIDKEIDDMTFKEKVINYYLDVYRNVTFKDLKIRNTFIKKLSQQAVTEKETGWKDFNPKIK